MPEMLTDHSEIDVSVSNENQDLSNTSLTLSSFEKSDSSPKTCNNCNNIIQEHAVKALGNIYHQNCFKCYDCGNVCKPKYFPFTINDESTNNTDKQVPLCQNDYFKRNNLICDVCKNLLKGTYYNAFGRLYDEEHFSCKICKETCSLQECFNFEGNLYCKFHYLKSYSKKCKGCEYPITDQHFEFERSGKIYRWHPECYGIHRYWHIDLRPSVLALPEFSQTPNIDDNVQISEKEKNDLTRSINISQEYNYKTWSILYKFEEESATCISDMLQFLTHEDKTKGTDAAALLVFKVNCLFKAIDSIQSVSGSFSQSRDTPKEIETDNNENIDETNNDNEANEDVESTQQSTQESIHTKYKKYPKSFSSRVMMYLQLLRKYDINEINKDKAEGNGEDDSSILSSAMSIINGLSHYLKLLIKFGVYNVLEYNKNAHSVNALEKFLREVNKSSQYKTNPFSMIKDVNIDSTDSCEGCGKYIQQECIVFKNKRWHVNCLKCDKCKNVIKRYDILDANYNSRTNSVLCPLCSTCDPNAESGFVPVSRLNNLTYLLKIALVKTRALVIIQMRGQNITNEVRTSSMLKEQSYMKTLNDIKNFRSKRNSMKIKKTSEKNLNENIKSTNAASSNEHSHSQETIHQFNNSKTLTLDDISRIVAMEQSRVGKVEPVAAKRPVTPTSKSVSSVLDTKKAEATSSVPIIPSRLKKMNSAFEVSSNKSLSKDRSPDLNLKTTSPSSGFKHYNKYEKNDKEESYEIYYSDLSSDHLYKIQLISLAILISNAEKKNVGDVDSILKLLKSNSNPVIVSPTLSNKFWSKLKSHSKKHGVNEPSSGENYAGNVSGSSPTPEQRSFNPDLGNNKDFDLSKSAKGVYEQPTQVFGVSLNKLTEAHGVDSDLSLGSNRIRIPLVLDELIASLKQLDLSMEGLFRINGNIRKLREFTEEINANPGNVPDFSGENAIQLAALLKKFFRELPEPLLTTTLYNLWAGSMHDLDRMKLVYALLPKYHRNCCEVLFSFLKYVSTFSSGSKMDIHNLGTVFAPNILYSSEENTHADSGIAIQVVEDLIRSNEQMVSVPDNLMELLKKTLDAKLTTDFATINDYLKSKNII